MDIIDFLLDIGLVTREQVTNYLAKETEKRMKPKNASAYISEKLVGKPCGKVLTEKQRHKYESIMEHLKEIDYVEYEKVIDKMIVNDKRR